MFGDSRTFWFIQLNSELSVSLHRPLLLFADAKPSEYFSEKIVGRKLAGDPAKGLLRETHFFCKQFKPGQLRFGHRKVFFGLVKCFQMTCACDEYVFGLMPTNEGKQFPAQQFHPLASLG